MLSYKAYIKEAVYKLTRQKTGVFKVLDAKLNETGITLDQNINFGKDWDIVVEGGISKGSFKTKHDATTFIEKYPKLLGEGYLSVFVDSQLVRNEYIDRLWVLVKESKSDVKSKKSLLTESKYWKLHLKDDVILSAELFKDRGTRKLISSIGVKL
jgi:hypothetical protein